MENKKAPAAYALAAKIRFVYEKRIFNQNRILWRKKKTGGVRTGLKNIK